MSDTNRVKVIAAEESTWGTAETGAFNTIRLTGAPNLAQALTNVVSEEIRSDRQIAGLILTDKEAKGDLDHELSVGVFDMFFEGALFSSWTEQPTIVNAVGAADTRIDDLTVTTTDVASVTAASNMLEVVGDVTSTYAAGDFIFFDNGAEADSGVYEIKTSTFAISNTEIVVTETGVLENSSGEGDIIMGTFTVDAGAEIIQGDDFLGGTIMQVSGFTTANNNQNWWVWPGATTTTIQACPIGLGVTAPSAIPTPATEAADIPVGARLRTVGVRGKQAEFMATSVGIASTTFDFTTLVTSTAGAAIVANTGIVAGSWIKLGGGNTTAPGINSFTGTAVDNDWVRVTTVTGGTDYTIAAAVIGGAGAGTFQVDGADYTEVFTAGVRFSIAGSTANDGIWTVASSALVVADTVITVEEAVTDNTADGTITYGNALTLDTDRLPSGWAADAAATMFIEIYFGDYMNNGTTEKSYTIEEQFEDHSPVTYQLFTGMEINTMTINADSASVATASISFLGKEGSVNESGSTASSEIDAGVDDVLNTSSDVGRIAIGGTELNYVIGATITINNNLRSNKAVGTVGAVDIGVGQCNVSGSLNTYFGDKDLLTYLLDNTNSGFDIRFDNSANDITLLIDIPSLKFSEGNPEVPGGNQDVTLNLGFQAYMDATLGYTILVGRYYFIPIA